MTRLTINRAVTGYLVEEKAVKDVSATSASEIQAPVSGSRTAPGYFNGIHAESAMESLFGVAVHRAQQGVDVDERAVGISGKDVGEVGECDEVLAQDRFELAVVSEGELAQRCSHGRGRVDRCGEVPHTT